MKNGLYGLYALQKLDLQLIKIDAEIGALKASVDAKKKYAVAKSRAAVAQKILEDYESELSDKESEQKILSEKLISAQKRVYDGSVKNTKELDSVQKEIDYLKETAAKDDERVLALYDLISQAKEKSDAANDLFEKVTKHAKAVIKKENDLRACLMVKREGIVKSYDELAQNVTDKKLLAKYKSISLRTKGGGIAKVSDGKCEGCKVVVTSYTIREVISSEDIVICENCGRILLVDEE